VRLELHPEARTELRRAALWYDERRSGLGDEFVAEVSAALDRIADVPEFYPAWPRTRAAGAAGPMIRKAPIHRFPYVIGRSKGTSSMCSSLRLRTASAGHCTGSRARTLERVSSMSPNARSGTSPDCRLSSNRIMSSVAAGLTCM